MVGVATSHIDRGALTELMAGLLLLVLVDVVAVAVACSLLTVPAAAVFHPHDLIPSFSGHVDGDEQEGYGSGSGSGNPQQPHSFTNGRGTYKFMAHEFLEAHNRVRARYKKVEIPILIGEKEKD